MTWPHAWYDCIDKKCNGKAFTNDRFTRDDFNSGGKILSLRCSKCKYDFVLYLNKYGKVIKKIKA